MSIVKKKDKKGKNHFYRREVDGRLTPVDEEEASLMSEMISPSRKRKPLKMKKSKSLWEIRIDYYSLGKLHEREFYTYDENVAKALFELWIVELVSDEMKWFIEQSKADEDDFFEGPTDELMEQFRESPLGFIKTIQKHHWCSLADMDGPKLFSLKKLTPTKKMPNIEGEGPRQDIVRAHFEV